MASLLPTDHSEFRSEQYWNDFFIKRQATTNDDEEVQSTFEWYGDWSDMSALVGSYVPPSPPPPVATTHEEQSAQESSSSSSPNNTEVLVIGCGNSTTSEEMFAQGYKRVTSNDFSDVVIEEMCTKTQPTNDSIVDPTKSWLKYEKMDFLNMTYADETYDLVFDKGALDALMSDDTARSKQDAATLFSEIDRVTKVGGAYVCITLAQKHIMKGLFRHFAKPCSTWDVHVHTFSPKLGSALCPFAFIAVKRPTPHGKETGMPPITTYFGDLIGENVHHNTNNTKEETKNSGSGRTRNNNADAEGTVVNMGQAIRNIIAMQQTHNFLGGPIKPGCAITLHLWPQHDKKQQQQQQEDSLSQKITGPKFTVTVLDAEHTPQHGPLSCGVFIVPRGREVEFLFNTTEGQMDLAKQAGFARLIVVAMERGHDFSGGLDQVKSELDSYMTKLAPPTGTGGASASIPYLTTGTDSLGHRVEMHRGKSTYSGEYAVEEVLTNEDDDNGGTIVRRLIFLNNSNLVQSEIRLVKPGKLKQKKNNKSSSKHNHDDAHDTNDEMVPYHGHVAFEFHLTMACSIGLLNDSCCPPRNPSPAASTPAPPSLRVLIVGLGGGCLPMFIHEHFNHVELTCVEIDAEMESIATNWFGYASNSARMTTVLGDGVAYIQNWKENKDPKHRQEKFHVVIFDVDAKDALKTGVSFPPKEFLTPSFIQHVESKILMEDGMLCINVASRSNKMFAKTINTMKNIFNVVDVVQYEESLNRIVFAYKSTALDDRAFSSSGGLEPLEAGAVLRRLKKRATKEWPAETDEDIMDAMEDVKSY